MMNASANSVDNKKRSRLLVLAGLLCALLLVFASSATLALAAPKSSSSTESASSSTSADKKAEDAAPQNTAGIALGDDVFLADRTIEVSNANAKANLFASGDRVALDGSEAGADIFAAGSNLALKDVNAANNAFFAGNTVDVNNLKAKTVFAAGNNLALNATAQSVFATGSRVLLSGTYEGDVSVSARTVIIDPSIVVKGTLEVTSPTEPEIASGAKIGNYKYNHVQSQAYDFAFAQIGSEAWLWSLLWRFLMLLVAVVFLLLVLRTETVDDMGTVVRTRPLATLITGLLSLVLLPLIAFLFLISIVGWQISIAVFLCTVLVTVLAAAITIISFGRLVMRKVNKWVTSIIMVVIFALLFSLPYANIAAAILCVWYSVGLVIQGWWTWRRKPEGFAGSGDPEDTFDFPRGAHMGPSGDPISPTPVTPNIPSSNAADYAPRSFS